jgi:hypothetical protein
MPIISTRLIVVVMCAALPACATLVPARETPNLPPGVFGVYEDNDTGAPNQASWAFANQRRTSNDPVSAARAVIAVEYLAGELYSNPRWVEMSASTKMEMVRAQSDTRRVLGIVPDSSPQLVVDAFLRFTAAARAVNQAAVASSLNAPVFTLQPSQTLQILSHLPYIELANVAALQASNEAFSNRR